MDSPTFLWSFVCAHVCAYALSRVRPAQNLDNCIINILQSRGLGGRLLLKLLDEIRSREIRIDVFCCRSEQPLEGVPRPLNCVFDGIGEILESADGDGFLGGISGGSIRLGLEWRYYLETREGTTEKESTAHNIRQFSAGSLTNKFARALTENIALSIMTFHAANWYNHSSSGPGHAADGIWSAEGCYWLLVVMVGLQHQTLELVQ